MYQAKLSIKKTQQAIKIIKDVFENKLSRALNLDRVSAPIIVESSRGINDDLGIKDSALKFYIESLKREVEIVQSLAKWKRIALFRYDYHPYEGIYTDMNAIRPKDIMDNTHSLYVDQWDWELVINEEDRTTEFLKKVVRKIVLVLKETKDLIKQSVNSLEEDIEEDVYFITSEELFLMYPNLEREERENEITKLYKTVFISEIGEKLSNKKPHDIRAADYDDWLLNGDLLIWSNVLGKAIEISSMGIRVNKERLLEQLKKAGRLDDASSYYHQMIINEELPLTIGGGIGQSRICMILLEKMHIAEVQASIWSEEELAYFEENNINIL